MCDLAQLPSTASPHLLLNQSLQPEAPCRTTLMPHYQSFSLPEKLLCSSVSCSDQQMTGCSAEAWREEKAASRACLQPAMLFKTGMGSAGLPMLQSGRSVHVVVPPEAEALARELTTTAPLGAHLHEVVAEDKLAGRPTAQYCGLQKLRFGAAWCGDQCWAASKQLAGLLCNWRGPRTLSAKQCSRQKEG